MSLEALTVAIRSGLYLDLMLLFGGAAFRLHALRSGPGEPRWGGAALMLGAFAGILLSILGLVALAATMSGMTFAGVDQDTVMLMFRETGVGIAGNVRLQALVVVALCGLFWRRSPRAATGLALIASGTALASLAWSGHGAMDEGIGGWVHLSADIVHLLAAGIWIGALAALLRLALRRVPDLAHLRRVHDALERFSAVGIAVVLLLVVSGFANLIFLVGAASLGVILTSQWSGLLLAKLLLFAAMLGLAAINRFRLTPALAGTPDDKALRQVRLSLSAETAAAILLLVLVAWLGMLEPPVSTI